jgi:hypothetical protein
MSEKENIEIDETARFCGLTVKKTDQIFPAIKFVASAVSKDPTRYHMNGIHIEAIPETGGARFIATDGRRLHTAEICESMLAIWESYGLCVTQFFGGTFEVNCTASLITLGSELAGNFPNWRKVIPETEESDAFPFEFEEKDSGYSGLFPFFNSGERFNMKFLEPIQKMKNVKWKAYFNNLPGQAAVFDGTPDFFNSKIRAVFMPMSWFEASENSDSYYLSHGFKEYYRATGKDGEVNIIIARRCPKGYEETEEAALAPEKVAIVKAEAEAKKKADAEKYEAYRREMEAANEPQPDVFPADEPSDEEAQESADIVDYIAGALHEMEDDLPDDMDIEDTAYEIARAAEKAEADEPRPDVFPADEPEAEMCETEEALAQTFGLDGEPDAPSNPQTIKWVTPFCGQFVEVTGDPTPPPRNKPHCEQADEPADQPPDDETDRAQLAVKQAPALAGFVAGVF